MVEPVDPFERGELDFFEVSPGSVLADHFGLEEAEDGFGQSVVVGISDASDRGLDPSFSQSLRVANRQVLPRFKVSSQRCSNVGDRSGLRQGSSTREFCAGAR